jgi:hypothetical protein
MFNVLPFPCGEDEGGIERSAAVEQPNDLPKTQSMPSKFEGGAKKKTEATPNNSG